MSSTKREVWLVAAPAELAETRRLADEAAASYGLNEPERFAFTFAVNEAVTNAIEHGSPTQGGMISIRFTEESDALVFSVQDYGAFRPDARTHGLPASRGRGLVLMASMVDELNLSRDPVGTRVRLTKR